MCCETQRARAARRATHKSRQYVREPERSSIKVQPPSSSLVQYTAITPPQNEGILSFALSLKHKQWLCAENVYGSAAWALRPITKMWHCGRGTASQNKDMALRPGNHTQITSSGVRFYWCLICKDCGLQLEIMSQLPLSV